MNEHLAIDIGASSGRCMLGRLEQGKMIMEEVHRFPNGLREVEGQLCWDYGFLFDEIKKGLKKCRDLNRIPKTIGIDTWGVDFVLLDENDQILGNHVGYRDHRTDGMDEVLKELISEEALYLKTGIQKQLFNSIYQLLAIKKENPDDLEKARNFLMVPDYLNFLLTGVAINEYTNATTTQLVNCRTHDWDTDLVELIGNKEMFRKIKEPGYALGGLKEEIIEEVGFNARVLLVASHDTASAVLALPYEREDSLYISSGSWSLMGTIISEAITDSKSLAQNFTNSGGSNHDFLYLKNIMGLWLIQEVSREYDHVYSYQEWCDLASESTIESLIDCEDSRFISPVDMVAEIKAYCEETAQEVPIDAKDIAAVVYNSLARSYQKTKVAFERLSGKKMNLIQIVGGGSQAEYLNKRTASETGCRVSVGPIEGTAIGNLICQMLSTGEINSILESKNIIRESFEIKTLGGNSDESL